MKTHKEVQHMEFLVGKGIAQFYKEKFARLLGVEPHDGLVNEAMRLAGDWAAEQQLASFVLRGGADENS